MKVFLLALAGFFLLGAAWAVALPVNGTYDESQHIVRAYAVVDGQWLPHGPRRLSFDVPASLLPADVECMHEPRAPKPATCLGPAGPRDATRSAESNAARYSPVYYLPVGVPLRLLPNATGVYLARLLSALLSAALLACAAWLAARAKGSRLLVAAVVLVATPIMVNLAGSVNPNGLEIAAGVLLFVALLVRAPGPAGVAAFALLTARPLGPVLFVVDVVAVAVFLRSSWRSVRRGPLLIGVGAGFLAAVGWALVARSPVGASPTPGVALSNGGIVRGLFEHRIEFYLNQIVGQFGYGETTISPLAVLLWYALFAVVLIPALWRGGARPRLVVGGLLVVGFGMLIAFEFVFVRRSGWFSHGRYAMPILVGAILIAAWSWRSSRWYLPAALIACTAPVQLYALTRVITRYSVGVAESVQPLGGSWHPPVGPIAPLLAVVVAAGLLTAAGWDGGNRAATDKSENSAPPSTRTVSAH